MKTIILISFILITIFSLKPVNAETQKLFSEQGYPYDMLIKRTDEIKIIYSESEKVVNCNIELTRQNQTTRTSKITVDSVQFKEKPFATCLPRKQAKALLANTFN